MKMSLSIDEPFGNEFALLSTIQFGQAQHWVDWKVGPPPVRCRPNQVVVRWRSSRPSWCGTPEPIGVPMATTISPRRRKRITNRRRVSRPENSQCRGQTATRPDRPARCPRGAPSVARSALISKLAHLFLSVGWRLGGKKPGDQAGLDFLLLRASVGTAGVRFPLGQNLIVDQSSQAFPLTKNGHHAEPAPERQHPMLGLRLLELVQCLLKGGDVEGQLGLHRIHGCRVRRYDHRQLVEWHPLAGLRAGFQLGKNRGGVEGSGDEWVRQYGLQLTETPVRDETDHRLQQLMSDDMWIKTTSTVLIEIHQFIKIRTILDVARVKFVMFHPMVAENEIDFDNRVGFPFDGETVVARRIRMFASGWRLRTPSGFTGALLDFVLGCRWLALVGLGSGQGSGDGCQHCCDISTAATGDWLPDDSFPIAFRGRLGGRLQGFQRPVGGWRDGYGVGSVAGWCGSSKIGFGS